MHNMETHITYIQSIQQLLRVSRSPRQWMITMIASQQGHRYHESTPWAVSEKKKDTKQGQHYYCMPKAPVGLEPHLAVKL